MENKYFDTDTVLKRMYEPHTFTLRAKVNTNDTIESVTYSQERKLFRNQTRIRKQYLNSLYGMCCSVRHGKSKRVKEWLDRERSQNYEFVDPVKLIKSCDTATDN